MSTTNLQQFKQKKKLEQKQRVEALLFRLARRDSEEITLPRIPRPTRKNYLDNLVERAKLENRVLTLQERQAGLRIYQDLCRDLGLEVGDI